MTDLAGRGGILRGTPAEAQAVGGLRPIGTVVETDRPVFTWAGPRSAQYKVSVYDNRYNAVATSGWLDTMQWTMPQTLTRGARYSWQLTVTGDGHRCVATGRVQDEHLFRVALSVRGLDRNEDAKCHRDRDTSERKERTERSHGSQKSISAVNLRNRGVRTASGCSHDPFGTNVL